MWCVRACGGDVCVCVISSVPVCTFASVCVCTSILLCRVCVYRMCYALMVEEATVLITL